MMPGMDGYEFVRELRGDPAVGETRVIFCTASYDEAEVSKVAESCSVSSTLIKPCEPEEIIRVSALEHAKPRSCMAVRSARTHAEQPDRDPLVTCEVCGKTVGFTTCVPLLVGGEVIGSVLTAHPRAMTIVQAASIKQSVALAAPVLANLRNLAIAEGRAKTDALTGLPNKRNVADNVKRMVAHASRTVSPLAALALDLDHFKQINDRYGHSRGDDVLAAVGSTLKKCCRESDLVGRVGGEEFLILLPDTGLEAAQTVAESIRAAIATIVIPSLDRSITASVGIAVLPDQAGDGATLLRNADRALYVAKNNGRNRVETFTHEMVPNDPIIEPILAETSPSVDSSDRDSDTASGRSPRREPAATRHDVRRRGSRLVQHSC